MAGLISAPGVGSGLDGNMIITQLMSIEARPLTEIRRKQTEVQSQISSYGKLKSTVSSFQDAMAALDTVKEFKQLAATSSNEDAFTVTATSSAVAGNNSINVINMAAAHKRASSAYVDSATDIGGTGTIDITIGANTSSITVAAGATLTDIRDSINEAADNPGVTASIINEAGGSRLILTSDDTGLDNAITVAVTDDDGNSADATGLSKLFYVGNGVDDQYAREITAAADAELEVDGFTVNSASNSVTGVIDGITIELKAAGAGTLTVARDDEAIKESIQGFVTAYNDLRSALTSMYEGELNRDRTLRYIDQSLLRIVGSITSTTGTYTHISQVGVSRDRYGTMSLDTSDLTEAMDADFESVVSLFSDATEGFATRLETYADDLLGLDGLISSREDSLDSQLRRLGDRVLREESRLEAIEERYMKKFGSLDITMASLNASSTFIMSQMVGLIGG